MIPDLLQRALQGDDQAVAAFGEAEHCAVIDWRDGLTEIVSAVGEFLPRGLLTVEERANSTQLISVQSQPTRSISISLAAKQEELLAQLNSVLSPDFELRQFRPVDGDGYAILVAPRATWSEMERTYPEPTERLFLTTERLATFWRKGYLARWFSKP
jgi:hypothetical protein